MNNKFKSLLIFWVIVIGVFSILPLFLGAYFVHLSIVILIYASLTLAISILARTGQISIGQAAFFGIGAYTTAILEKVGFNPILGFIFAGIVSALFALLLGLITLRLKGIYFSIATLCFAQTLLLIANRERTILGGATGIIVPPLFGNKLFPNYYFSLSLTIAFLIVDYLLYYSKMGYASTVIRHDERVANSIGINPTKYKILAFVISSFLTGIIGAYYIHYVTFTVPDEIFATGTSVAILAMAIFGGIYTAEGPFIGAVILKIIEEYLRLKIKYGHAIIYGLVLILTILFMPNGVVGLIDKLKSACFFIKKKKWSWNETFRDKRNRKKI